jgi:hypothetical protein
MLYGGNTSCGSEMLEVDCHLSCDNSFVMNQCYVCYQIELMVAHDNPYFLAQNTSRLSISEMLC